MFKKVAVMAFSLTTLLASTCLAVMTGPVPDSEASLGGITLGSLMSYVRSIYGAPTDRVPTKDYIRQDAFSNIYGNSFYVIEYPKNSSVEELYVTANNGLATPMGITVGIPKSTVDKLYGEGSFVQGSYRYLTQEGKVIQIKYVDDANDVAVVKSIYIRYSA